MAISQSLQQKLLQKLSPQQIQLMKLLQVPTINLEERIKEEMEENPALELSEEGHDENGDDLVDEFATPEDAEFEKDGSEEDYQDVDVSEYVYDDDGEMPTTRPATTTTPTRTRYAAPPTAWRPVSTTTCWSSWA
jgi:RNA polymerase sigma-54 factor